MHANVHAPGTHDMHLAHTTWPPIQVAPYLPRVDPNSRCAWFACPWIGCQSLVEKGPVSPNLQSSLWCEEAVKDGNLDAIACKQDD